MLNQGEMTEFILANKTFDTDIFSYNIHIFLLRLNSANVTNNKCIKSIWREITIHSWAPGQKS